MNDSLPQLFKERYGSEPESVIALRAHASERKIYRLQGAGVCVCGVVNPIPLENRTFIYFAEHFRRNGLSVPEILAVSEDELAYLTEDLGDVTLYDRLQSERSEADPFPKSIESLYERSLEALTGFQVTAGKTIDYTQCFQVSEFSAASMLYDMQYFSQSFLAKIGVEFNDSALLDEFGTFAMYLSESPRDYFMYRDFQARNIMVREDKLFFIDFQGGRKGPLQYDVVSLLYQSSALVPDDARDRLVKKYVEALKKVLPTASYEEFVKYLNRFILIRMMQVLGTYGRQGLEKGKDYFAKSIPPAVKTLCTIGLQEPAISNLTELRAILEKLRNHEQYGFKT